MASAQRFAPVFSSKRRPSTSSVRAIALRASCPRCAPFARQGASTQTARRQPILRPAARSVCRRALRRLACAVRRRAPPPDAYEPTACRPASPMCRARSPRPRVREDAAVLRRCRSTCSALRALASAHRATPSGAARVSPPACAKTPGCRTCRRPFPAAPARAKRRFRASCARRPACRTRRNRPTTSRAASHSRDARR
ncbi:hypothetical protein B0G57_13318 [Trinickia symbiotica]|nr:hypothetical protein B0G57_13318 [Trinickia symbiotica]